MPSAIATASADRLRAIVSGSRGRVGMASRHHRPIRLDAVLGLDD
jgi:hypothetical protein